MNTLESLFAQDIHRQINGVVKAEQHDAEAVRQELSEYVITQELDKHFRTFYRYFNSSLDKPGGQGKNGIWISGFFGSGKSHFLKMLGYLLANQSTPEGLRPLDYFKDKVKDSALLANIGRPTQFPMDVVLFNIDSKARVDRQNDKASVLSVFWRVFDELRGYYGGAPHIAEMEAHLDREGLLSSFQQSFERIAGASWHDKRRGHAFLKKPITEALQEVTGLDASAAAEIMSELRESVDRTVENFAKAVRDYLNAKGPQQRLLFLVDEVGQYIGDSSDLMLNLQTIVEDLNIHCGNRAWVVVTSQEDIDSILKHLSQVRRNDFSKIQGRFYQPLSLTSANTDEVIKKRLLDKTPAARDALTAFYAQQKANLSNLISFSQQSQFYPKIADTNDFVDTYPFLPYQFKLLQQVFRSIREAGGSGRHMAEGERSMLESFKLTLELLAERPLGTLVPFYCFYAAMEGFLDHAIRWVFQQAEQNPQLEADFDIPLLKVLFMLRWVKELKPNQDNLLTLMIDHVDCDRVALRSRIQGALARLEQQTLVQRNGDEYYFLTNEEQEIMRKIKAISVDPAEVTHKLEVMIWGELFDSTRLRYDAQHQYDFNRMLDGRHSGLQKAALTLHLISPCDDSGLYSSDSYCISQTLPGNLALVRLPNRPQLYAELQHVLQTEKYFMTHSSGGGSVITRKIQEQFQQEKQVREAEIARHLARLVVEADVFVAGMPLDNLPRKAPADLLNEALRRLVQYVYPKLDAIAEHYTGEAQVDQAFVTPLQADFEGAVPNQTARGHLLNWLEEQALRKAQVTVATVLEQFAQPPFGWAELDTLGLLAELVQIGKLELRQHQQRLRPEAGLAKRLLSKQGRKEVLLTLQQEIAPALINQTRRLLDEVFGLVAPPQEPEKLFGAFSEQLQQQLAVLDGYLRRSAPHYPCHDELLETQRLLQELARPLHYQDFFELLARQLPRFEGLAELLEDFNSFFGGQVAVFDRSRETLQALASEVPHLNDAPLQQAYAQAEAILQAPAQRLYRELPKVSFLLEPVKAAVAEQLQARQREVQQAIAQARSQLQALYAEALADTDASSGFAPVFEAALAPLQALAEEVAQASKIDTVLARASRVEALEATAQQQIADWLSERQQQSMIPPGMVTPSDAEPPVKSETDVQPALPPEPPPKPAPALRPVAYIHPAKISNSPVLEDQADVERYIARLKDTLLQTLAEGKRIQLR